MFFCPVIPYVDPSRKMIDAIANLGLTSNLQLCLDAGDLNSYASGQTWEDVSGASYDFLRGSTSSSQSSDPTFTGTPGGDSSSEYWAFDGGDFFTAGSSNPTWVNNIHKNNATFTLAAWVYLTGGAILCGDYDSGTRSFSFLRNGTTKDLVLAVNDGAPFTLTSTAKVTDSTWSFVAVAANEASNALTFQINGTQETHACTYSSPSSGDATSALRIGSDGDGNSPMPSGSRMASFMGWSSKLADADLLAIYNATKSKFGL